VITAEQPHIDGIATMNARKLAPSALQFRCVATARRPRLRRWISPMPAHLNCRLTWRRNSTLT
jgi:hypothetical protein